MSFREIFVSRLDDFMFRREQRLQQVFGQPSPRQVTHVKTESFRKPPLFGADPTSGPFEDYVVYRVPQVGVQGVINPDAPKIERENIHGFVPYDHEPPVAPVEVYQDPATSPHRVDLDAKTDQKPISTGALTPVDVWDGQVRATEPRKDFQAARTKSEPTIGDLHALELKKAPYDFSF